jgi:hypothetical protein
MFSKERDKPNIMELAALVTTEIAELPHEHMLGILKMVSVAAPLTVKCLELRVENNHSIVKTDPFSENIQKIKDTQLLEINSKPGVFDRFKGLFNNSSSKEDIGVQNLKNLNSLRDHLEFSETIINNRISDLEKKFDKKITTTCISVWALSTGVTLLACYLYYNN